MFKLKSYVMPITIALIVLLAGIFSSVPAAAAKGTPGTPLAPGLTWTDQGESTRTIQLSVQGDAIELAGKGFVASESFATKLPSKVLNFYSNTNLYDLGWASHDAYEDENGTHMVYVHTKGYYLSVDTLNCDGKLCLSVWMSKSADKGVITTVPVAAPAELSALYTFVKLTPVDGEVGVNPYDARFTWTAYTNAQRYSFCVYDVPDVLPGNCDTGDPNWTGSFTLNGIKNNLNPISDYEWKLKASTCWKSGCNEWQGKADGGLPSAFTTDYSDFIVISGTTKMSNTVITYDDGIDTYSAVSNSTGVYSLTVFVDPILHTTSGTLTPEKSGYSFFPLSYTFADVSTNQTNQNFTYKPDISIGGKTSVGSVTITFTGSGAYSGVDREVISSSTGLYAAKLPYNWSGSIVASKAHYTFSPTNYSLTPQILSTTNKNFTAVPERFNITGTVYYGPAGGVPLEDVVINYVEGGITKTALSDVAGEYLLDLPYGWSGTITPSKTGYVFVPSSLSVSTILGASTLADIEGYQVLRFVSNATYDGEILETSKGSNIGGSKNSTNNFIRIGDNGSKQQYKGVFSFNTLASGWDPTAVISSAKLQLRQYAINKKPFTALGDLNVEIYAPYFGSLINLESADFEDASGSDAGIVTPTLVNSNYFADLDSAIFGDINFAGTTQFKLSFDLPTDNDSDGDYVSIHSGSASTVANRPVLQILYYIP